MSEASFEMSRRPARGWDKLPALLLKAPLLVTWRIPAPSLHPWMVLTVSSTRRRCCWFTLMSPICDGLLSQWWSSHRRGFQRWYEPDDCSRGSGHHVVGAHVRHFQAFWLDHGCGCSVKVYCRIRRQDDSDVKLHRTSQVCVWRLFRAQVCALTCAPRLVRPHQITPRCSTKRDPMETRALQLKTRPSSKTCLSLNSK